MCWRKVPCRMCTHASTRLLRRSTQQWRRSCTACQQTKQEADMHRQSDENVMPLDQHVYCLRFSRCIHDCFDGTEQQCKLANIRARWRRRGQQERQQKQEAAADSFRAALLQRRMLFGWRQGHARLAALQGRALELWTAGSRRSAFRAWAELMHHRRAVVSRLALSAAANTRCSSFRVSWSATQLQHGTTAVPAGGPAANSLIYCDRAGVALHGLHTHMWQVSSVLRTQRWRALASHQRLLAKSVRHAVRVWRGRTRGTAFAEWREAAAAARAEDAATLLAAAGNRRCASHRGCRC